MFMSPVCNRLFSLPAALRPLRSAVDVETYPGVAALWARSTLRHIGDPVFGIEAVVVHVAQRSGTDDAMAMMQAGRASWHWIVPAPSEDQHGRFLWSAAPEGRAARHLPNGLSHPAIAQGRPRLNHATLSVLLAADPARPGAAPTPWQIASLAQLLRQLWSRYPALASVVCRSALDPLCPAPALDWGLLRDQVTRAASDDLPVLVARSTPLALLHRAGPAEPALRAG